MLLKNNYRVIVSPLQSSVSVAEFTIYWFIMDKAQKKPMKHEHSCTHPLGPDLCV